MESALTESALTYLALTEHALMESALTVGVVKQESALPNRISPSSLSCKTGIIPNSMS